MKLLIADDNPAVRELLARVCAGVASEVRQCGDGAEAVAVYFEFLPDWVLMDIEMPGTDGLTATKELKRLFPKARVVIVTQHRGEGFRKAAHHAGALEYVLKEDLASLPGLLSRPQSPDSVALQ